MKAAVLWSAAVAGALALAASHEAAAQAQPQTQSQTARGASAAPPVHVTIPPGGLTFNFSDIDRNGDSSISVEEWNAFVASLPSRLAAKDSGGAGAGGGSAPRQPQQSQQR
jgi:hypothetical protein